MAKMDKPDPDTTRIFDALAVGLDGERRKMFGCPCLFVNGNMVAGVYGTIVFFRVPPADQPAWKSAHPELLPFAPMSGTPMKEYLSVVVAAVAPLWLAEALEIARDYGLTLPAKTPKVKKSS